MERPEAEAIYAQGREAVVAVLLRMDEQIQRLSERVARQDERIAELERRLSRNSRNSSTPPSQDPPGAPERGRPGSSGRGQGAEPGHPGRGRRLLPAEAVDEVVEHWPRSCGCGHPFAEDEREPICAPARHQVSELPEIAVQVTEHRLHRLRCVFRIAPDRHEREATALLGEDFEGVVGSDRWWAYRGFDPARRQVCWSHLIRDFTAHAEGLAAQQRFGDQGLDIARRLFCAWEAFRADGDRRRLRREVAPLRRELRALLERGSKGTRHRHTRGFAKNLLKVWPALWTFATVPGVEPTNNAAERALRGPVIHRKLSLGSQSEGGERTIERLLSASVTCRLQGRSLFAYLVEVAAASIRGERAPSLA